MRQSLESRVYEGADIIDSRDVIARIEELEAQQEEEGSDFAEEEEQELTDLQALAEEASGSPGWAHGETLIADSYFKDYARQFAEDIGAVSSKECLSWPFDHVDWAAAAEALQQDYASVTYGDTEYWIRA